MSLLILLCLEELQEDERGDPVSPYGFNGDGREIPKGATSKTLEESLDPELRDKLEPIDNIKKGAGTTPTSVTFSPAMIAAKKMQKKIQDQLDESSASKHLRSTAFEMALFGTGVMKGPFAVDKEYPSWDDETGEYILHLKQYHRYHMYLCGTFILIQMLII